MADHKRGRTRRSGFQTGALTPQKALELVQNTMLTASERATAEAEIAKTAVREVATVVEIIPRPSEQSRKRRRLRVNRSERENDMSGSRSTGETPGQGAMAHLEKELHKVRSQEGSAKPEDAAKAAFKRRMTAYSAIPIPDGLPQLPPSTLSERPHPGKMPPRRPSRPEAKNADPAAAPSALPEAAAPTAVHAAPLGETALQQLVGENLGEAYVHPPQATPPADPQA